MELAFGGEGIRFTDQASTAVNLAYQIPNTDFNQVLLCFVIAGDTIVLPDEKRNVPPKKPDQISHYDSVTSQDSHFVAIYDSAKHYPAYVVNFRGV